MRKILMYPYALLLLISFQTVAQTSLPTGYPDRNPALDVLPGFVNPPKGYGDVPFYWWQGDTITRERLTWQLDQLSNKGISSLQINYSHQDFGGISYGLSNPSKPALFTPEWWKLFKWFAAEAQKRGMTVSLSDYTIGIGQGYSMDEAIADNPDLNGSQLRSSAKSLTGSGILQMPQNLLTLTALKINPDSSLVIESRKDLLPLVKNGTLAYSFGKESWKVISVFSEKLIPSYDPMHPESGKAYNHFFFEKFENALKESGGGALNFFFSDEVNFRVGGNLWNSYFAGEFKKRKGYDVVPFLDALYLNIGPITPKIKLDYNDVLVSLSEENFFKPVYDWHQERGMIFGCDHGGRGKDVAEFGDYFRTQRWNQGPGSDQPGLSKDIIKAKVAASIAHLYERPRVWLEGFYGSSWGTTSSDVTEAIFGNFVAGYNLLSFHGLYYSTQGGWWEWAPPCNHFRMPYWKQIDPLMTTVERLSYLLSQGVHNCDVAILYPTEPVVAGMDGNKSVKIAFETGELLYDQGVDFDFIDFESIARSEIKNGELHVAGENFKILVVPSMKAMRHASLEKLAAFKKAGGIIVNIGDIPSATERFGADNTETSKLVASIFSKTQNLIQCEDAGSVYQAISGKYVPNFKVVSELKERPYVMHRVIGKRDVYALYNFAEGTKCFFKAKGTPQLWNPWNGETASLSKFAVAANEGTEVTLPLSKKEIQIIVFDPDGKELTKVITPETVLKSTDLGKTWDFELKPSMDNQWGDFQLPAKKEMLGAQMRQLYFSEKKNYSGGKLTLDNSWENVTCAFGKQFLKLGPLAEAPSEQDLLKIIPQDENDEVTISGKKQKWEAYGFSWKQGVEGDPGHQGYHGLKGKMYDDFIRLGALKNVKMSKDRLPEAAGNYYLLYSTIVAPADGNYDLLMGDEKPVVLLVNNSKTEINSKQIALKKGANPILLMYDKSCKTYLAVRKPGVPRPEKQQVAMSWYGDNGLLPFDCSFNNNSSGLFAFESAPGLNSMTFAAYGKVTVWMDGIQSETLAGAKKPDGLTSYSVKLKNPKLTTSQVAIKIEYQPGYRGGAALPQYIEQQCGKSTINLGDWSKIDGLKAYSGGAWYRKTITVSGEDLKNKLVIDLGDIVSSAELLINGKSAGIKLTPPWKFDITPFVKSGKNNIEILIYNTIANNYTTVPTMYRGEIKSGLIGPVRLTFLK
jgi:hypothetical protein